MQHWQGKAVTVLRQPSAAPPAGPSCRLESCVPCTPSRPPSGRLSAPRPGKAGPRLLPAWIEGVAGRRQVGQRTTGPLLARRRPAIATSSVGGGGGGFGVLGGSCLLLQLLLALLGAGQDGVHHGWRPVWTEIRAGGGLGPAGRLLSDQRSGRQVCSRWGQPLWPEFECSAVHGGSCSPACCLGHLLHLPH